MQVFDEAVQRAFARGMGVAFSDQEWLQIRLPMALGGAGLRHAVEHLAGAYLASVANAAAADGWAVDLAPGWEEAWADVRVRSG